MPLLYQIYFKISTTLYCEISFNLFFSLLSTQLVLAYWLSKCLAPMFVYIETYVLITNSFKNIEWNCNIWGLYLQLSLQHFTIYLLCLDLIIDILWCLLIIFWAMACFNSLLLLLLLLKVISTIRALVILK